MPQTEGSVASVFCPAKADRMWDIAHAWVREDGREYCLLCGQEREARKDVTADGPAADVLEIGGKS